MTLVRKPNTYRKQFQDLFCKLYPELTENKTKGLVKNITFVVTEDCNLRCTYCYQCNKDYSAIMSKETAKQAVDMILNDSMMEGYISSEETPGVILEFIGGEPLLQIDLIDYTVQYFLYKAYELNHPWYKYYMISMTSNGLLYNTSKVQSFVQKYKSRLSITITIDGDKRLHDSCRILPNGQGSYDIVVESIKKAITDLGMKDTKVTFAPENIQYISTSIPHLMSLGLTDINANCVYENVWDDDRDVNLFYTQLVKLADYIIDNDLYTKYYVSIFDDTIGQPMPESEDQNWCGGNGQMLAIGTDGRLFPCIRFMKYSLHDKSLPEFEIGNVKTGIEKEEDNEYLKCLSCIGRRSQSTDTCYSCPVASGCAWCTGFNYDYFKTPNKRATFICGMHKARVLANYYYWNKIYKKVGLADRFKLKLTQQEIDFITKGEGIERYE